MAFEEFIPPIPPSEGTSTTPKVRVRGPDYGIGLTPRKRDGINHIRRTLRLSWDILHPDDAAEITTFLRARGGDQPFYYRPSDEVKAIAWTCEEWTDTRGQSGYRSINATFIEVFDNQTSTEVFHRGRAQGHGSANAVSNSWAEAVAEAWGEGFAEGFEIPGSEGVANGLGLSVASATAIASGLGDAPGLGDGSAVGFDGSARYWRINITAQNGYDGYTTMVEMGLYTTIGGANAATGGTAIESGHWGGAVVSRLFDGSTGTEWSSPNPTVPNWVGYDFGAGNDKRIVSISLQADTSPYNNCAPKDFTVEASHDGTNWTTVWTVTNSTGWSNFETRLFIDPAAVTYISSVGSSDGAGSSSVIGYSGLTSGAGNSAGVGSSSVIGYSGLTSGAGNSPGIGNAAASGSSTVVAEGSSAGAGSADASGIAGGIISASGDASATGAGAAVGQDSSTNYRILEIFGTRLVLEDGTSLILDEAATGGLQVEDEFRVLENGTDIRIRE